MKSLQYITAGLLLTVFMMPILADAQVVVLPGLDQIPAIQQGIDVGKTTLDAIPKVPVSDPLLEAKDTGITIFGFTLPISWNQLAINIGRIVVNQVVNSTVNWMRSGFNGQPAFIGDPASYFKGLANGITGDYLNQIAPGICSAYSAKIVLALGSSGNTPYYTPQCTLTQIGVNFTNFVNNFQNGGWNAWFAITQNDDNNPYQVYINAQGALNNKVTDKINNELTQLNWGNGFKSVVTCTKYNGYPKSPGAPYNPSYSPGACIEGGEVDTPGATIKAHLDDALPGNNYIKQIVTADQFDKLLSALAQGVLQKFVFKSGGLLGTSSGNGSSGSTVDTSGSNQTLSCFPSPGTGTANETEVTWTLSSGFGSNYKVDYTWSGEGVDGKTGYIATTTYQTAGTKTASVTATATKLDDLGNVITGSEQTKQVPCAKPVVISKYRPLTVSCSAAGPALTAFWETPVVWNANISGGSGEFTGVEWGGDQDFVPGTNNDHNRIWPNRFGAPNAVDQTTKTGNTINIVHQYDLPSLTRWNQSTANSTEQIVQSQDVNGGFLTNITFTRLYYKDGNNTQIMHAHITVTDKDLSLPTVTAECDPTYTLIDR